MIQFASTDAYALEVHALSQSEQFWIRNFKKFKKAGVRPRENY